MRLREMTSESWTAIVAALLSLVVTLAADHRQVAACQDEELGLATPMQDPVSSEERQETIQFLIAEIDNLTPGDLKANAEQAEMVNKAVSAFVDGSAKDAEALLEGFRRTHSSAPPTSLMMAALYFALGDPAQGMQKMEDAAIINPGLPTVYNAFARVAIAQQRRTDALVLLEKSKRLIDEGNWSDVESQHFKAAFHDASADLYILRRDFTAARDQLGELAKLKGDLPRVPLRLAEIAFEQEQLEAALEHLANFRELVPTAHVPEIMLATLFARRGQMEEAANWLETANTKYVGDSRVAVEYIDFMVNRERFDKAKTAIEAVEKEFGELAKVQLLKGKLAFAEERYIDAEVLFAKLNSESPDDFEIANLWALALAESDRAEQVAKALRQAQANVQKQPNNAVACAILGMVYLKQGNLDQAQGWLARAGQSGQLTPEVGFIFARFLQHRGEIEQAKNFINGALQHQGLFLYRRAAARMQGELRQEQMPSPSKN